MTYTIVRCRHKTHLQHVTAIRRKHGCKSQHQPLALTSSKATLQKDRSNITVLHLLIRFHSLLPLNHLSFPQHQPLPHPPHINTPKPRSIVPPPADCGVRTAVIPPRHVSDSPTPLTPLFTLSPHAPRNPVLLPTALPLYLSSSQPPITWINAHQPSSPPIRSPALFPLNGVQPCRFDALQLVLQ